MVSVNEKYFIIKMVIVENSINPLCTDFILQTAKFTRVTFHATGAATANIYPSVVLSAYS